MRGRDGDGQRIERVELRGFIANIGVGNPPLSCEDRPCSPVLARARPCRARMVHRERADRKSQLFARVVSGSNHRSNDGRGVT